MTLPDDTRPDLPTPLALLQTLADEIATLPTTVLLNVRSACTEPVILAHPFRDVFGTVALLADHEIGERLEAELLGAETHDLVLISDDDEDVMPWRCSRCGVQYASPRDARDCC
jgi:hypothetical protein